ncbi:MAG: signal peptidase I [Limnochordia bacterium]|jgi:signal peptidase I|nr:signal peptidase I [Limnochordia bacterium]MDD2629073.1 signal peptidase I [Limnochordia bacterium]MDD4517018.1 signal peptidase I [Limnochordia bacterium]
MKKIYAAWRKPSEEKSTLQEAVEILVLASILAFFFMTFIARAFTIDGPSMLPTLTDGERLLIDKVTYRFRPPKRGEIVVFKYPASPKHYFIKRVVALPGDVVAIKHGKLLLNGNPVDEPYINQQMWDELDPVEVPEDSFFVLGDNRNNSKDSRSKDVGFVPRDLIIGRAIWRYWPLGKLSVISIPGVFAALE